MDFEIENGVLKKYHGSGRAVTIPDNVTSIGKEAFRCCFALTSVIIPDSVTSIGDWAFNGCKNLTDIVIPNDISDFGANPFSGTPWIEANTDDEGFAVVNHVLLDYIGDSEEIIIPDGIVSIGKWAIRDFPLISFPPAIAYNNIRFTLNKDFDDEQALALGENIRKFFDNPEDTKVVDYLKENMEMCIFIDNIEVLRKLLDSGKFVTKKNIDKLIQYAIDKQKHEAQVTLTNYKEEKGWYEDTETALKKKFRL